MDKTFAQVVETILECYEISEPELARRLDTSQPTVNRIRNGKQEPKYKLGAQLMDLYENRPRESA